MISRSTTEVQIVVSKRQNPLEYGSDSDFLCSRRSKQTCIEHQRELWRQKKQHQKKAIEKKRNHFKCKCLIKSCLVSSPSSITLQLNNETLIRAQNRQRIHFISRLCDFKC